MLRWSVPLRSVPIKSVLIRATQALVLVFALVLGTTAWSDQSDPALPELYEALKQASDPAQAAQIESQIWQVWLQAPDEESTDLLMKTARAMQQTDFREALILSTQLTEDYPDYAEGWNKRATVFYLMGNYDMSVSDIYETLKREPRHFGAISGLGLIFQRRGNLEGALAAFEQVLAISPQSINARRNAQQIRQELGSEI